MIAGNRKRAAGCRDFEFLGQALVIDVETKRLGRRVEIGSIDEQRNLVGGRWHPNNDLLRTRYGSKGSIIQTSACISGERVVAENPIGGRVMAGTFLRRLSGGFSLPSSFLGGFLLRILSLVSAVAFVVWMAFFSPIAYAGEGIGGRFFRDI